MTPTGEIVAIPLRGAWTGNRGCLHRGEEIVRFHAGNLWIVCGLEFNDRHSELWRPGRFTWLFFHDEAVAFAAGHRPCGECRHGSYVAYRNCWAAGLGGTAPTAGEMNRRLHAERLYARTRRRRVHDVPWARLPTGAFVLLEGGPALVLEDQLVAWSTAGYGERHRRPGTGSARVLTPPSTMAALSAGYPVQVDAGAHQGQP